MSRKLKAELGLPDVEGLRGELDALKTRVCGTCTQYKPTATDPAWGHCIRSGKAFHAPVQRSDMDSCSKHDPLQL